MSNTVSNTKYNYIGKKYDSNKYNIKIEEFEGPLDLLCYLVSKNKMEIETMNILEIIKQYLEYLEEMQKLNLEIASEFTVMASKLIYLKSKKILTKPVLEDEEEYTEEELIAKLEEYKKYKEISEKLNEQYSKYNYRITKKTEQILLPKKEFEGKYDKQELFNIYMDVITRYKEKDNINKQNIEKLIIKEKVTVKSKLREIFNIFKKTKSFVFNNVFSKKERSKQEIIAAFLGVLEMSNKNKVNILQEELFAPITISRKQEGE